MRFNFRWISWNCPWFSHDFPWFFHVFSMLFQWLFHDFPMIVLWFSCDFPITYNWYFGRLLWSYPRWWKSLWFPWESSWIPPKIYWIIYWKMIQKSRLSTGWWFGCHFWHCPMNIGFLIIPIDELIFFRGVAQPPTSQSWVHQLYDLRLLFLYLPLLLLWFLYFSGDPSAARHIVHTSFFGGPPPFWILQMELSATMKPALVCWWFTYSYFSIWWWFISGLSEGKSWWSRSQYISFSFNPTLNPELVSS